MHDVSEINIDISVEEEPEMKLYEYELVPVGKYEKTANKKKSLSDVKDLDNEYLSAGGVKKAIEDAVGKVNTELDNKADKDEVYTKEEIDSMGGTVRVTLSIDEGGFDWWDLRGNTEAKSKSSLTADMTASDVYDLYNEGKDIVVIDPNGYHSGYDPVVEEGSNNTTMETLVATECVYRFDSVQDDIIMFTKSDPVNPLIIHYVKAYISTNTWVSGSYTADSYSKKEIDDKIGDIDAAFENIIAKYGLDGDEL